MFERECIAPVQQDTYNKNNNNIAKIDKASVPICSCVFVQLIHHLQENTLKCLASVWSWLLTGDLVFPSCGHNLNYTSKTLQEMKMFD